MDNQKLNPNNSLTIIIFLFSLNLIAQTPCEQEYPDPQLSFSEIESYEVNGVLWKRYRIPVTNYSDYDEAFFIASPNLPPCGANENSSRSWVKIYDQEDNYLYGFCALSNGEDLQSIWFAIPEEDCPSEAVYVVLEDRLCEELYTSNLVELPECEQDECADLIVSDLIVTSFNENSISYDYTIKNIGEDAADLNGPTSSNSDNISIQCFVSSDTIFNNGNDTPAGGTILGASPLPVLAQGETFSGSFNANVDFSPEDTPYLKIKVDWGEQLSECLENNNFGCAVIQPSVSILELDKSQQYRVFPNPVSGSLLFFDFDEATNTSVNIYNSFGRCIIKNYLNQELDVSDFSSGVYYLSFFEDDALMSQQKLVKF